MTRPALFGAGQSAIRLADRRGQPSPLDQVAGRALQRFQRGKLRLEGGFRFWLDQQGRVRQAGEALTSVSTEVANACARRLGSAIRRFTLGTAVERQHAGQLEFHDLLVLARAVVDAILLQLAWPA